MEWTSVLLRPWIYLVDDKTKGCDFILWHPDLSAFCLVPENWGSGNEKGNMSFSFSWDDYEKVYDLDRSVHFYGVSLPHVTFRPYRTNVTPFNPFRSRLDRDLCYPELVINVFDMFTRKKNTHDSKRNFIKSVFRSWLTQGNPRKIIYYSVSSFFVVKD